MSSEKWQPCIRPSGHLASSVVEIIGSSGAAMAAVVLSGSQHLEGQEVCTRTVHLMWLFLFVALFLTVDNSILVL